MCEAEPATEVLGSFIGRAPIKRHQRTQASRHLLDLCAPLVESDRRHFDAVLAAIDDLFEMMHGHGVRATEELLEKTRSILAREAGGASERIIEGASTCSSGDGF